jgi:GDP-L-fucose synthase
MKHGGLVRAAMSLDKSAPIYVAGHRGLVGSAIFSELRARGFGNVVGRTRAELDLLDQQAVEHFFDKERPAYVLLTAARVGGIKANDTYPATFLYENLQIQNNVVSSAAKAGVRKLLFLGSSCIYPRLAPQPLKEEYLLTGPLEKTNEWYAIAKIAGIKLCQAYRQEFGCDFISVMPTNLYGPNDNFDLESSHVIPALLRRFHEAKIRGEEEVICWGTGTPRREFLYSEDLARACLFLMENYSEEQFINVGSGTDLTIAELANLIREVVGYAGEIRWDRSKPDGTPRKLMDSSRLNALGWRPEVSLEEGLRRTYEAFLRGEAGRRTRPVRG